MDSSPPHRTLSLDLGNTSLKVLLWEQGALARRWRVFPRAGSPRSESPEAGSPEAGSPEAGSPEAGSSGAGSSGAGSPEAEFPEARSPCVEVELPSLEGIVEARGVRVPGQPEPELPDSWPEVLWAGEALLLPGSVQYRNPEEMGADRRVAAWGAHSLHGSALVLDCGTALTLTHVNEEGEIRGLGISTGYGTLRQGLAQAAPALGGYIAEGRPLPLGVPDGSAENLSLGLIRGWAGLLCRLLQEARARLDGACTLVLTGSDAPLAAELLGEGEIQAELLHLGLLALERRD